MMRSARLERFRRGRQGLFLSRISIPYMYLGVWVHGEERKGGREESNLVPRVSLLLAPCSERGREEERPWERGWEERRQGLLHFQTFLRYRGSNSSLRGSLPIFLKKKIKDLLREESLQSPPPSFQVTSLPPLPT